MNQPSILEYYSIRSKTMIKDFRKTIDLMQPAYASCDWNHSNLKHELSTEYAAIIPTIPYYKGYRQRMFNNMLLITAQMLAVYKALKRYGMDNHQIWDICHQTLDFKLKQIPKVKKRFLGFLWNTVFRKIMIRRAKHQRTETLGGFELTYVIGRDDQFDYGINYSKCGHAQFLETHDALDFLPYICLADLSLSHTFDWGLYRTQTLGDGCNFCDFRFKKGSLTCVSSKTPEVQAYIESYQHSE